MRRVVWLAVFVFLASLVPTPKCVAAAQQQDAKARYEAARKTARQASKAEDLEAERQALLQAMDVAKSFPQGDRRMLGTLESLAHLCQRMDRHQEAASHLESDLEIRRQVSPELLLDGPWWSLLDLYETLGQLELAEQLMVERIALLDEWRPEDLEEGREARLDLVDVILRRRPEDPAVESLLLSATDLAQRTAASPDADLDEVREALSSVAWRYERAGRLLAANELLAQALEAAEAVDRPDLDELARLQFQLAESYQDLELFEPAIHHARRAVELQQQRLGLDHPYLYRYLRRLGTLRSEVGDHRGAIESFERALRIGAAAWGERSPSLRSLKDEMRQAATAIGEPSAAPPEEESAPLPQSRADCCALRARVDALRREGRVEDAVAFAEAEIQRLEVTYGPSSLEVAEALDVLDGLHWETDTAQSLELHDRRLRILEATVGLADPRVARTAGSARYLASVLKDYELAERYSLRQLASLDAGGRPAVSVADALEDLANLRMQLERYEEALEDFRLAADLRASIVGEDTPEVHDLRRRTAWALIRLERYGEGEELLLAEIASLERREDGDDLQLRQAVSTLSQLYSKWDRREDAKALQARYPR